MTRIFLVAFLVLVLGGCQTTYYDAGTTPLTMTPWLTKAFEKYKQADYPTVFAVATDGSSYAYFTCPSIYCDGPAAARAAALCEQGVSPGVKCKIFADDRQIVWKGPVTYGYGAVTTTDTKRKRDENADRAVCVALPYENPYYVAEASRRGLTAEKCKALLSNGPAAAGMRGQRPNRGNRACTDRYDAPSDVVYCWRSPEARPYKTEGFCSKGDCAISKAEYDLLLKSWAATPPQVPANESGTLYCRDRDGLTFLAEGTCHHGWAVSKAEYEALRADPDAEGRVLRIWVARFGSVQRSDSPGSGGVRDSTDRAVCVALPYKNPAYVAEASRRGLTAEKCQDVMKPPPE